MLNKYTMYGVDPDSWRQTTDSPVTIGKFKTNTVGC